MSTRLYLSSDETAVFTPGIFRGAWDKTAGAVVERLTATRTGSGQAASNAENVATANYDVLIACFVTDPLLIGATIAGTLDAILLCAETNADANDVLHIHAWVTQGDSGTARGTLLTDYVDATEWAVSSLLTAFSAITMPQQSLSSVSALAGDRIVVEIGYQAQNTHTTNRSGGIVCGGRSSIDADGTEAAVAPAVNNVPWVQFSADLAFAPTYLYTANDTAPATPAAVVGTWDVDNKQDKWLKRTKAGSTASRSVTETSTTNPTDGLAYRFIGDELAAQTITVGPVHIMLRQVETAADADAFTKVHLYVMKPDGTVRGTLLSNSVDGAELSTSLVRRVTATLSSQAVSAGDRLVLEAGARFTNVTATAKSVTISSGETSADVATSSLGDSSALSTGTSGWVRFEQHLLWLADVAGYAHSQCVIVG